MGMMDKFKDLVGIEEIDEDDYEQEVNESKRLERKTVNMTGNVHSEQPVSSSRSSAGASGSKVVSMQNRNTSRQSKPLKLVVIEPSGFEECPKLVDGLKTRKPIIVNLEQIESDVARKIFDFLSGATYALDGTVQKVATNIFVFAPENIDIALNLEKTNYNFATSGKGKDKRNGVK